MRRFALVLAAVLALCFSLSAALAQSDQSSSAPRQEQPGKNDKDKNDKDQ